LNELTLRIPILGFKRVHLASHFCESRGDFVLLSFLRYRNPPAIAEFARCACNIERGRGVCRFPVNLSALFARSCTVRATNLAYTASARCLLGVAITRQ